MISAPTNSDPNLIESQSSLTVSPLLPSRLSLPSLSPNATRSPPFARRILCDPSLLPLDAPSPPASPPLTPTPSHPVSTTKRAISASHESMPHASIAPRRATFAIGARTGGFRSRLGLLRPLSTGSKLDGVSSTDLPGTCSDMKAGGGLIAPVDNKDVVAPSKPKKNVLGSLLRRMKLKSDNDEADQSCEGTEKMQLGGLLVSVHALRKADSPVAKNGACNNTTTHNAATRREIDKSEIDVDVCPARGSLDGASMLPGTAAVPSHGPNSSSPRNTPPSTPPSSPPSEAHLQFSGYLSRPFHPSSPRTSSRAASFGVHGPSHEAIAKLKGALLATQEDVARRERLLEKWVEEVNELNETVWALRKELDERNREG
ncbi:hypothetical protein M427DRAFT_450239 [Gonapodya prolifera JEL478]|uniref:Uncharacterized protein n=1 Tax=Gonapodya prolifera (strain JEL478) TaxID=1344416 RepID=A0A139ARQ0_GONPJ|nr:hypothetical protein M427DRAFT_450239 [Gonapodya prolifera JEL478]|eukprot:KXS19421.1 hypothetical protein M427DRAFT_450239 [Gonapodya prolifera JEL478]